MCEIVTCSCCGEGIRDNAEENVSHGKEPYPEDRGFGMCKGCGGDPDAKDLRKRMGWGLTTFVEARFGVVRKNLSEENRKKWDRCSYAKKVLTILEMVEKGAIV